MAGRYRRTYTDSRGRRVASGFVVVTTNHPAAAANGPAVHEGYELVNGVLSLRGLPPNTYALHARLVGKDGEAWTEIDHITLEGA